MSTAVLYAEKPRLSLRAQSLAALAAVVVAVALPQLFHVMGAVSGLGTALGETFLPMHLPILLVGLLAGPLAGALAGVLAPLISFGLTGMPGAAMLPFMMIELCAYGFLTGQLRNAKMPTLVKILLAQIGGRAIRAVAILVAFYGLGRTAIPVSIIWTSVKVGIFGLALQWTLIPLLVYRVERAERHER